MGTTYPRVETLVDIMAAAQPDHLALRHGARTWTYAAMRAEMDRRAAVLVAAGLAPGTIVATNEIVTDAYALSFLACCRADIALFGLSAKLSAAEIATFVRRAGVKRLLTADGRPHPAAPDIPALSIALPGSASPAATAEAARRSQDGSAESVVFLQTTSGTTGSIPKIVRIPHRTYTWRLPNPLWWEPADGIYYVPQPNLFGARSFCTHLGIGGTIILAHAAAPAHMEAEMEEYGATVLWSVPAIVQLLSEYIPPPPPGLRLRYARTSAAPLPPHVAHAFAARYGGIAVQELGLTEGGSLIGTPLGGAPDGSIGKPYRGVIVRVVDDAGNDVAVGETGELVIQTPGLALGYLDSPEAAARTFRNGWLWTGDLGWCDADGFYYIVGRHALRINVGGFKVAPEEVEAALMEHPAVREVVVLAMPDARRGEVVRAIIVPRATPPPVGELRRFCRERLATYKVPRVFEFRDELPRSAIGKVLRHHL